MDKLIKSHFKKGRAGFAVLTLFILLAVFLLTTGLSIVVKVDTLYEDKKTELNSPDMSLFCMDMIVPEATKPIGEYFFEALSQLDYVKAIELDVAAELETWLYSEKGWSRDGSGFFNKDSALSMRPKFTTLTDGEGIAVYMPQHSFLQNDVAAGEKWSAKIDEQSLAFYVAGSYESSTYIWGGTGAMFVDGESYEMLKSIKPTAKPQKSQFYRIDVQFFQPGTQTESRFIKDKVDMTEKIKDKFIAENGLSAELKPLLDINTNFMSYEMQKQGSAPYLLLISAMMVVFSLVMTAIALIIINFMMRTGIEDDMRSIGIFKALGYETKQLRQSYVYTFGILLVVGALLGMVTAIFMAPIFDQMLYLVSSLKLSVPPNPIAGLVAVAVTVGIALLTVWLATRKLKEITPLNAMRGGIKTHSFKKNHIALDKCGKLGLNTAMGLKSVVNAKRQSILVAVVVFLMSFICVFSGILYYNCNVDRQAMIKMSGQEDYEAMLTPYAKDGQEIELERYGAMWQKLATHPKVDKILPTYLTGSVAWLNENIQITRVVIHDFDAYNNQNDTVYEGRNPKLWNEAVVSGDIASAYGIKVGDVIKLTSKDFEEAPEGLEFTVVGLAQRLSSSRFVHLTAEANEKLNGKIYNPDMLHRYTHLVYFKDKNCTDDELYGIMDELREMGTDEGFAYYGSNGRMMLESMVFKVITPATEILMAVIFTLTAVVIAAVVFMIIRMKMIREKQNVSIMKSLGYTGTQIMHQFGLSMLLIALPSSIIGAIFGGLLTNPLIAAVGSFLGLYKVSFIVPWLMVVGISLGIAAINYAVAVAVALGTRFITPRSLISQ